MDNSEFIENTASSELTGLRGVETPLESGQLASDVYRLKTAGKWVMVKRPKAALRNHPVYLAAFEKEYEIGASVDHPNIVTYLSKGRDERGVYIVTNYVDGSTLTDFVAQHPDYYKHGRRLEELLRQVTSAVACLHEKQILHLDLKPDNVMITTIGHQPKIIDLGMSYSDCYPLTTGMTRFYAAPEQLSGGRVDTRTDVYAIGLLALYAYTGTTSSDALTQVPRQYRRIIAKCLAEDPDNRYADAAALGDAIAAVGRQRTWTRAALVAALTLIAGIIVGGAIINWMRPRQVVTRETVKESVIYRDTTTAQPATKAQEQPSTPIKTEKKASTPTPPAAEAPAAKSTTFVNDIIDPIYADFEKNVVAKSSTLSDEEFLAACQRTEAAYRNSEDRLAAAYEANTPHDAQSARKVAHQLIESQIRLLHLEIDKLQKSRTSSQP